MSNPTGMHTGTAQHLEEVHARMLNHINRNNHQSIHSVHGHNHHSHQTHEAAYGSNTSHYGHQPIFGYSTAYHSAYEFSRLFLHNFFHPKK
ncbi:hypothetical protein I4U23_010880 [Adineta vaga]|nr:hypothetical protein I4U23_010880 [Adineta vaga]